MNPRYLPHTIALVFCLALQAWGQQKPEINQWLNELSSDSYAARENATEKLGQLSAKELDQLLFYLEHSSLSEVELRLFQVVKKILDRAKSEEIETIVEAISQAKNASSKKVRDFAGRFDYFTGHPETKQIVEQFRKLVKDGKSKIDESDPNPEVISDDFAKQLIELKDFKLVQQNRNSLVVQDLRSRDAGDHQEILAYRIKWFKGGWSRWFVPGVNDADSKVKGDLMWRYFRDHESQYIQLLPKYGPYSRRQTFLPPESIKNSTEDEK